MIFNKTCKENFKDTLNTDKSMMSCHNIHDTRRLITPSSLKKYEGVENIANYHAEEAGTSTIDNVIGITRRTKETLHKEKITPRRIEITNSQLKNSGMIMHNDTHNRKSSLDKKDMES